MKDVKDRIVLITGGAGGIGRLMALDFAARGARVAVWDIDSRALAVFEEEGRSAGLFIRGFVCDVTDRAAVYRQAEILRAELGPVDILVNNAGIVSGSTLLETPDEKIEKTLQVNTLAHFWTCKAFLPSMIERNRGHLVTISSAAGIIGVTGLADYSASKFAVFGLNEAIRMELRKLKSAVRTTVVCPFFIDTGMFQGVKTRFPTILPILKSEYVARRVVEAVLKNRQRLLMPRLIYTLFVLRLFSTAVLDAGASFFGVNNTMDDFIGRAGNAPK
ncbi:MAG: SDR family oxidoreductase [Spirochaetaceae bacterium]|jgi:all-trans-retinol dehydrogenase (NAD+)|nr:SDR family oxidoreductase [Spirochaetaceae bacterium]